MNNKSLQTFDKLFFLTTMTSELSKYLNEQLGVIFKRETAKMKSAKNIKKGFLRKNFFVYCNILSNTYVI